jgi:hypothetical protein
MSFLALAKQAEAQLRAANGTTPSDAIDAVNAVSSRPPAVVSSSAISVAGVATYQAALHAFWRLVALGPAVDRETAIGVAAKVAQLIDVVGEPVATEMRHRLEAEWHRNTGRCARCGARGERHT